MLLTIFSAQPYDKQSFNAAINARGSLSKSSFPIEISYENTTLSPSTAVLAKDSAAVCVFVDDNVNREVIACLASYNIKAVLLRSAGFNNVDLEAAQEYNIAVARVPAYSPEAVAEHALTLVMALNRHIPRAYNRVRDGNFLLDGLLGRTLSGKVVGIYGTGRIGLGLARIFKGMGCRVLASDPVKNPEFASVGDYVELDELMVESDIISLHAPLLKDTHHVIDKKALKKMKNDVILINTSRGALIDTEAAIEALREREIGALGLDVYEHEDNLFFKDNSDRGIDDDALVRLLGFPNVLITGHQGFFTQEALQELALTTLNNMEDVLSGKDSPNIVKL